MSNNSIAYIEYNNKEYENFITSLCRDVIKMYPPVPSGKGTGCIMHILLTSDSLQRTINCINNSNRDGEK